MSFCLRVVTGEGLIGDTKMKWIHLDLFSGIGGASYAADQVWGKEKFEHIFCDNEPFAQQVLKKHWPTAQIYGDIRTLTNSESREADASKSVGLHAESRLRSGNGIASDAGSEEQRGVSGGSREKISEIRQCYLLTGGFPCQPFSQAGRRKGTEDNRYLWPEMFRVIREFKPKWIVGENVAGLVTWSDGLVLRQVFADLESAGYEVEAFVIPAVALNAPHRRDRVWIIANAGGARRKRKRWQWNGRVQKAPGRTIFTGMDSKKIWKRSPPEPAIFRMADGLYPGMDRVKRLKAIGNAWVPQVAIEIFKAIKKVDENIIK